MDHGDHAPARCSMHMLFTWDTKDLCVVFPWWHVRGPWSLFFTLLGVVFLGMSYELLRHIARKYDESSVGIIRIGTPDPDDRPRTPTQTAKFARRRHIIRAGLYGVQVFYSYLLMLVAMTYQGHVLIAIGIGAALGFYLFQDDKTATEDDSYLIVKEMPAVHVRALFATLRSTWRSPAILNSPTLLRSHTAILDDFLAQYPAIQSVLETMKSYYITPKVILLFIFGLLVFIHGITADDKTPPSTLQIGVKHRVPEEECTRKTKNGDKLKMHYRGTLFSNGEVFDSSYDRGRPFEFKLGAGQVIKGWDQGLLDMCVGEKRKLVIPPDMAYGDRSMGAIKAGSTLVFDVELIEIVGVPLVQKQKEEL